MELVEHFQAADVAVSFFGRGEHVLVSELAGAVQACHARGRDEDFGFWWAKSVAPIF